MAESDPIKTVVIKRDDTIPATTLAVTPTLATSNVLVQTMSAVYAVLVRTLRVFAQSFMGILSAQGMGAVDAILDAQVTPTSFSDKVVVAFWLALAPAAFTLLQNAAELIMRLDEKLPRWRACVLVPLLGGALLLAGCAGKSKALAVRADATIYTILVGVQQGADTLAQQGVITAETRRALSPHLLAALRLADDFNRGARAGTAAQALPPLLRALETLRTELARLLPGSRLIADVDHALLVATGGR